MSTSLPNTYVRGRKKTMIREKSLTNATRKIKNTLRRQCNVDQEWNSSDESSESKSDEATTIAIKDKTSSSKSLFPQSIKAYMPHGKGR
jgi:hypothetical protein